MIASISASEQTLSIIAIATIVAGIFAPTIIKWIIRKQKGWRFKLIKDNGRFDLVDEFNYWYKRLASERKSLEEAATHPDAKDMGDDVTKVIGARLDTLNKFLASRITGDKKLDDEAADEIQSLIDNRQEFMDSTRMAFMASHPDLMHYLQAKGLTTREQNYCCLFLIGLRSKEIGGYLGLRSHYNISSSIRAKLGLESTATNLGIYLRKLMHGETPAADDNKDQNRANYTPRQVRGALLVEIGFDYLGLLIISRAFVGENLALEIGVIFTTILLLIVGVRALILYRADIVPVAKLISSMDEFSPLQIVGSLILLLLFAEPFIPQFCYPYIGYTAFITSQLLLLFTLNKYTR